MGAWYTNIVESIFSPLGKLYTYMCYTQTNYVIMKILLLAHSRSGSTILSHWLSAETGYKLILEPYRTCADFDNQNNIIVKELINHLFNNKVDLTEFISKFDKVIGLVREDTYDCAISNIYCIENNIHHTIYEINEEWVKKRKEKILQLSDNILSVNNQIKSIPNILQITYEGVYNTMEDIDRIKNFIEIDTLKYSNLLDNKLRYRNNKRNIL